MNPMKDSGIEWIGKIPEDWKITKIKYTTQLNGRIGWQGLTSNEYQDEGPFLITGTDFKDGKINFDSAVHIEESRWAEAKQIQVENGDLLITKDGTVGKVAIIEGLKDKASLNSGVLRIQTSDEVNRKFLYYTLLSEEFWLWFNYTNSGASTILHLYQNVFDRFIYTIPPLHEQQAIADFLDIETKKLDDAKDLLQQQIEKLKEYQKSLIWETVTKGLDKSVPMKDSGIDWIGEIPKDWEVRRLKQVANKITDFVAAGSFADLKSNVEYLDEPDYAMLVRAADLSKSRDISRIYVNKHGYNYLKGSNLFGGEIILPHIGSVGDVYEYHPMYIRATIAPNSILVSESPNNHFLYYLFIAGREALVQLGSNQTTQAKFNKTQLKEFKVIQPSICEQNHIVTFLDEKTSIIEKIILNTQSQIEVIDKQKKTLIYDYVTGKRRVI